jgi:hypothetical protein
MIDEKNRALVERELAAEYWYVQREIFHSANFVRHKYHVEYLGLNLDLRDEMLGTNRLSYDRTHEIRLQADL